MTDENLRNSPAPAPRGRPFARSNPGKKPGTRNRATVLPEKLLSKDIKHIASKVVELEGFGKEGWQIIHT